MNIDRSRSTRTNKAATSAETTCGRALLRIEARLLARLRNCPSGRGLDDHLCSEINHLADAYKQMGMPSGAEFVLRHLLEGQERILGFTDRRVAESTKKLAELLRAIGRRDEADVMEIRHHLMTKARCA